MVLYIDYNLIILAVMSLIACILICVRAPDRSSKAVNDEQRRAELHRELVKTPIPWGWPHYEKISFVGNHSIDAHGQLHSFSESLSHLTERLVQEKHTVDNIEYVHKKEGWVRALLEDRYGRSGRRTPAADAKPGSPHSEVPVPIYDQMENVPNSRADKLDAKIFSKEETGGSTVYVGQLKMEKSIGSEYVKMPWGW